MGFPTESQTYLRLDLDKLHKTIAALEQRILAGFPSSNLSRVAGNLKEVSQNAQMRLKSIRRPIWALRILNVLLLIGVLVILSLPFTNLRTGEITSVLEFIVFLEPAMGSLFLLSAFVVFVIGAEQRIKRGRVLAAMHELRALAHIVDMHQLNKDPDLRHSSDDQSYPKHGLTPFELSRYLDYCSELLSLISKLASLYTQDIKYDSQAILAVDDLENLCTGLSRKIWQKIMLLETTTGRE